MIEGLGRPENYEILAQLRTARDLGIPLSTLRRGAPADWSRSSDRAAALALTMYEDGLHDCGQQKSRCMHPEMDGYYEVRADICYAGQAVERWVEENREGMDPGTVLWVVDTRDDGNLGPLPKYVV